MVGSSDTEGESKARKSILQRVKSFEGIQLCATAACLAWAINTILAVIAFARGYSQNKSSDLVTVLPMRVDARRPRTGPPVFTC